MCAKLCKFGADVLFKTLNMQWIQKQLSLKSRRRGFHIITDEIEAAVPEMRNIQTGMCQVFIQHTSASLTINESADPSVRVDFESWFNRQVKENDSVYTHNSEGPDDMPAHLKASLLGTSVLIPVTNGRFTFGTWQGIYLCEHRDRGGPRRVIITIWGQ